MHPESTPDRGLVRWVVPFGTVPFVGMVASMPGPLGDRLVRGEVTVAVTADSVDIGLSPPLTWRADGAVLRAELAAALAVPAGWAPRADVAAHTPSEALDLELARRAQEAVDGAPGDRVRSHGGEVELVGVRDGEVMLELSGACGHCAAASFTLMAHFENELRRLAPGIVHVRAATRRG